jgi:type I restriction enzyme S subunit
MLSGDVPFITPGDMSDNTRTISAERYVSTAWDPKRKLMLPKGAICVVCIGMTIGKVCLTDRPSHTNQQINSIIVDISRFDPGFLYYAMRTIAAKIRVRATGAQTRIVNKSVFSDIEIVAPPLELQHRIAAILGAYDDLIDVNWRRVALLEDMARGLFEEWFVRFRYPGHQIVEHVDTPGGPLPKGWSFGPFTDIADVLSGGTPKKGNADYWGGDIPFFTPRDAPTSAWTSDTMASVTEKGVANCSSKLFPLGTVFITARGTVGKVALAATPMAMNQSCYALVGKDYPQLFLFGFTQSAVARLQGMSNGAVFDTIIVDTFRKLEMVIPPIQLAYTYEATVAPLLDLSRVAIASIKRLAASRDLLLPRLISGQLSVEEAERELAQAA